MLSLLRVARLLGRLLVLLGLSQLLPAVCALLLGDFTSVGVFLASAALCSFVGWLLGLLPRSEALYRREGVLFVVAGWAVASVIGAVPYLLSGAIPSPVDAFFESASGFTTTGASVLTDIEAVAPAVLMWRSFTQWLGGLGIIVLLVALLSELGPGTRFLYRVEVPGPSADFLQPRVRETATALLRLYVLLTTVLFVLLLLAGLSWFDAAAHTFSTLSTGGFSPHNESAAAFGPVVQWILIVFMVIAGTNFSLLYELSRRRPKVLLNRELSVYLALLAGATVLITGLLVRAEGATPHGALLDASFQVVSLMTSTGFASRDYAAWPSGALGLVLVLMMIGGCAGSTAGGIKVMRIVVGLKSALREARLLYSPNAVIPITLRGQLVSDPVVQSVSGFLILFLMTLFVGSTSLTLFGWDLVTSFTAALAALGNIGPGLGEVGPSSNFAAFGPVEKCLLVLLMWLGRLELLAFTALITKQFWLR